MELLFGFCLIVFLAWCLTLRDKVTSEGKIGLENRTVRIGFRNKLILGFFGTANAGKSSGIRALFSVDVPGIHPIPGTTRDIAFWHVDNDLLVADTPGLQDVDEALSKASRDFIPDVDCVVYVVNANGGITEKLLDDIELLKNTGKPLLVALNKMDEIELHEKNAFVQHQISVAGVPGRDFIPVAFNPLRQIADGPIGSEEVKAWIDEKVRNDAERLLRRKQYAPVTIPADQIEGILSPYGSSAGLVIGANIPDTLKVSAKRKCNLPEEEVIVALKDLSPSAIFFKSYLVFGMRGVYRSQEPYFLSYRDFPYRWFLSSCCPPELSRAFTEIAALVCRSVWPPLEFSNDPWVLLWNRIRRKFNEFAPGLIQNIDDTFRPLLNVAGNTIPLIAGLLRPSPSKRESPRNHRPGKPGSSRSVLPDRGFLATCGNQPSNAPMPGKKPVLQENLHENLFQPVIVPDNGDKLIVVCPHCNSRGKIARGKVPTGAKRLKIKCPRCNGRSSVEVVSLEPEKGLKSSP